MTVHVLVPTMRWPFFEIPRLDTDTSFSFVLVVEGAGSEDSARSRRESKGGEANGYEGPRRKDQ